ncbi:hypothetical protein PHET_07833 [Paragonimus heterotremus]|uniref:MADS-box domain-containing protein n=1 Tax=Paragonimus heterotremus TaxID=100268 RepID=A0A8J4WGJ6_9TREM|nr:hypothetical protein PHET_07833 [Paragonimus heterotremus]
MGRRKIQIKAITDEKTRLVTFAKRKNGLFKKAYELSVLCECEIALIVFTKSDRLHQYASYTMEHILHRRDAHPKSNEFYTNQGMCKLLKDRSLSLGGGLMTPKVDTDASSNLVIDEDFGSDSDRSAHQTSIAVKDRPLKPRGRPRVVRDNFMEKTYKPSPPHETNKPQDAVACNVSTVTVTANVDSLCNQSTARESSRLVSAYCRFPTSQTVDIDAEVKSNDDTLSNSITSLEAATTLARTLSTQTMMLHYAVLGHSPPLHDQGNMAGSSLHTLVLLPDLRLTGTTATAAGIIAGLPVRTADQCPLSLDKSDETSPKPTSASVTEVDDQELQSSQSADVPSDRSNACSLSETTLERTQFPTDTNVSIDPSSTSVSGNQILKLEPSKSNDVTTHTCSFRAKRRPSLTLLKLPSSSQTQPSPASGVIPKGTFLPTPVLEAELNGTIDLTTAHRGIGEKQ